MPIIKAISDCGLKNPHTDRKTKFHKLGALIAPLLLAKTPF
jgi:hypothetical protein